MITIRSETMEDYKAIHKVNVLAFGQENESKLIENLHKSPHFIQELSLVALKKLMVVGHILFSRIAIQTETGSITALSPAHWPFIQNSRTEVSAINLS
jgi:putative acetyltransferase